MSDSALARPALARAADALRKHGATALLATLAGLVAMLVLRAVIGLETPSEYYADAATRLMPLNLFSTLLGVFGSGSKHLLFTALVIGQGVVTLLVLAALAAWRANATATTSPETARATRATVITALVYSTPLLALLVVPFLLVDLAKSGVAALAPAAVLGVLASGIVPAATSGIVLALLERAVGSSASPAAPVDPSRRRVLRQFAYGLVAVVGGVAAWRFIFQSTGGGGPVIPVRSRLDLGSVPDRITPPPVPEYSVWSPISGQTPETTRTDAFYYVSKNFVSDPKVDAGSWKLTVTGRVNTPLTLSYADLRALPAVEQFQTLECISNDVGGNLMSTARWTGASLANLLQRAGLMPAADSVIFRCADGYSDQLHLAQALGPRSLIAYDINGQRLPQAHGFPARLLVPGLYGMKNGKWLTSLEAASGSYDGYWEQRGWTREARVKLMARIDVPGADDVLLPRATVIAGVAFSGDQGIAEVQVSTDGGQTWSAAALRRPLAEQTWVLWEFPWTPMIGTHVVVARAIDLMGRVQTPKDAPPLPDGASGYHAITVHVG
jgi:DMSO/TMAO reductase YedYZ molybdopterin-dependent catalytic subunit